MRKSPRVYPQELKEQVVSLVLNSQSISQVSRDLDIPSSTIDGWISKAKEANTTNNLNEQIDTKRLLKELRDVKEERDILKKALAIFSKRPEQNTGL